MSDVKVQTAREIAEYVRQAPSIDDAEKLLQLWGDLRVAEATPGIIKYLFDGLETSVFGDQSGTRSN